MGIRGGARNTPMRWGREVCIKYSRYFIFGIVFICGIYIYTL